MFDSKNYWIDRYKNGRTSGNGSYGFLADYKSEFINTYIDENNIKSLLEYGCGDGNQLSLINCETVIGVDISKTAVEKCRSLMPNRKFICLLEEEFTDEKTDLLLSLDVIYHLIEDEVYNEYIKNIISHHSNHLIIYSANYEDNSEVLAEHVKPRKFTENTELMKHYDLIRIIKNKYPSKNHKKGSFSDWYIFNLKK